LQLNLLTFLIPCSFDTRPLSHTFLLSRNLCFATDLYFGFSRLTDGNQVAVFTLLLCFYPVSFLFSYADLNSSALFCRNLTRIDSCFRYAIYTYRGLQSLTFLTAIGFNAPLLSSARSFPSRTSCFRWTLPSYNYHMMLFSQKLCIS
jgi:hypothetical protein